MTDIQKAIKFAEGEIKSLELAPKINGCGMTEWWKEQIEVWKTAISALEKQIPKKLRVDDEGWLCCPKCDETFKLHNQYHEKNRYCGNCGQKICWGDSE